MYDYVQKQHSDLLILLWDLVRWSNRTKSWSALQESPDPFTRQVQSRVLLCVSQGTAQHFQEPASLKMEEKRLLGKKANSNYISTHQHTWNSKNIQKPPQWEQTSWAWCPDTFSFERPVLAIQREWKATFMSTQSEIKRSAINYQSVISINAHYNPLNPLNPLDCLIVSHQQSYKRVLWSSGSMRFTSVLRESRRERYCNLKQSKHLPWPCKICKENFTLQSNVYMVVDQNLFIRERPFFANKKRTPVFIFRGTCIMQSWYPTFAKLSRKKKCYFRELEKNKLSRGFPT